VVPKVDSLDLDDELHNYIARVTCVISTC